MRTFFTSICMGLITLLAAQAEVDTAAVAPADESWKVVEKLLSRTPPQAASREAAMVNMKQYFGELEAAADSFLKQYPQDPRSWDAKWIKTQVLATRASILDQPTDPAVKPMLLEIAAADGIEAELKTQAQAMLLDLYASENSDEARAYVKSTAAHPNRQLASRAAEILQLAKLKEKPIDLAFTSLDGQKIDLEKLRGKVVLLEFWATWCGPCRMEMPKMLKTYADNHARGLEIIGISLDRDKAQLETYIATQGIKWPQHFDGKGFENELANRFGIHAIPAQWLIDKKGFLRSTNARQGLDEQLAKLLAE